MSGLRWRKRKIVLSFGASATTAASATGASMDANGFVNMDGVGAISLVMPAEFNTDTLTLTSASTSDTGIVLTGATGRVTPTSDQARAIACMPEIKVTTNNATAGAAIITIECLSGFGS
jgi:hypothetical protein